MQSVQLESNWAVGPTELEEISSGQRAQLIDIWSAPTEKEQSARTRHSLEEEELQTVLDTGDLEVAVEQGEADEGTWIDLMRRVAGRPKPVGHLFYTVRVPALTSDTFLIPTPLLRPQGEVEAEVERLADEWERGTLVISSPTEAVIHRAYQRIIGFGPQAVPAVIRRLQATHRYWFWALAAMTGENPAEGIVHVDEAVEAWVNWAQTKGILPQ